MTWELTPEIEEVILSGLEDGFGLVQICQQINMPSRRTVLRWQREIPEFGAKCAHAREAAGELSADNQQDIVDRMLGGELASDVARVALSAMQWRASKLAPKKYGDKTVLSNDPENPLPAGNVTVAVTPDVIRAELLKVRDEF